MFGHVCLGGTREVDDFADVPRGIADGLQDAQTGGFSQHLKDGGDALELFGGEGGVICWLTHE